MGVEVGGTCIADDDVVVLNTAVAVLREAVSEWFEPSEVRERKEDTIRQRLANGELTLDLLELRRVLSE